MANSKVIKSKLQKDDDLIPPDGGWGWMIVIAAGLSNLSLLPMIQQFGLLYRDKFIHMGISSLEITTILNMNSALISCVGLANGPMFRFFSYRQVSLTGAVMMFVSLIFTMFSYNFITYFISLSILCGSSYGINSSANALALNTYWKSRRRLATGLSWTMTGLGPIIWPHITNALFISYGETGAILILCGISLHAVACSLLLQPVEWHSKSSTKEVDVKKLLKSGVNLQVATDELDESKSDIQESRLKTQSLFSSQYLYSDGDSVNPVYEITDPGIPMMPRANDGYFSHDQSRQSRSKVSSQNNSNRNSRIDFQMHPISNLLQNRSYKSSELHLNESKKNSSANFAKEDRTFEPNRKTSVTFDNQISLSGKDNYPILTVDPEKAEDNVNESENHFAGSEIKKSFDGQYEKENAKDNYSSSTLHNQDQHHLKNSLSAGHRIQPSNRKIPYCFNHEREILKKASFKLDQYLKENEESNNVNEENNELNYLSLFQKVALFFDLDLLKDFTFINLMLGMTIANFAEINFSLLTPYFLGDYGKTKTEVALFMSLLAGVDMCVRFCIPFVAEKIGWENNSFFLFGVLSMAMGRIVLATSQTDSVVLLVAVMIGFGKGLRTVFIALVIPTYVPLHKLPGATGLQLLSAGIIHLILGPLVGWVKDNVSTGITLHCLNIFTWLTTLSWGLEKFITARRQKSKEDPVVTS